MSTQQQFRQTALVIALSAVFPLSSAWAEDDDVAQLISPNVTEVTVNVPLYALGFDPVILTEFPVTRL